MVDKNIKYLDGRRNGTSVIGNETIKQTKELGISTDERKYEDRDGNKAEIRYISGRMAYEHLFAKDYAEYSQNENKIMTKVYNAFGISFGNSMDFDGRFEEVNGKVIQANGTQKLCFVKEGDNVIRKPQLSFHDLMRECKETFEKASDDKDYLGRGGVKDEKYSNLFMV